LASTSLAPISAPLQRMRQVLATSHILVDARQIRISLGRFLVTNDLRVTQAENAAAMFAALDMGRFDFIVLDVMMAGEDGLSARRNPPSRFGDSRRAVPMPSGASAAIWFTSAGSLLHHSERANGPPVDLVQNLCEAGIHGGKSKHDAFPARHLGQRLIAG
jgi:hypothetical protein